VVFFLDDTSEDKGINTVEMNELAEKCDLALVNALKDSYPIVTEPALTLSRFAWPSLILSRVIRW